MRTVNAANNFTLTRSARSAVSSLLLTCRHGQLVLNVRKRANILAPVIITIQCKSCGVPAGAVKDYHALDLESAYTGYSHQKYTPGNTVAVPY